MLKIIIRVSCLFILCFISKNAIAQEISAFVWKDNNGDGLQSLGELGIPNIVVKLYDCNDDSLIDEVDTDLTGKYTFTDVAMGMYYLVFDPSSLPPGCAFTLLHSTTQPTDNDADADGVTACLEVGTDDITDIDAGLLPLAQLCGDVWEDFNGDGLYQTTELDLLGFAVELFDENDNLIERTVTDSMGQYSFDNIYPGNFFLKFHSLPGWEVTFANQGDSDTLDNDVDWKNGVGTTSTFALAAGAKETKWDAGFFTCGELGKWVWYDTDFDDTFDVIENGVNGLTVNAYRLINDEWVYWTQVRTGHKPGTPSDDGYFTMCLPPGKYYLQYNTAFSNLVPVIPNMGSTAALSSSVSEENGFYTTDTITMLSGVDKCDVNAGFYPASKIGNLVWKDLNGDGIYQGDEPPIAGVNVELYTLNDTLVGTQTTDQNGNYTFDNIRKGSYYLKFYPPDDCIVTPANVGNNDAIDSDVDGTNGPNTTMTFFVNPDEEELSFDLGLTFVVLPIGLTTFDYHMEDNDVELSWTVIDQDRYSHFVVERQLGDGDFELVYTVQRDIRSDNLDYAIWDRNIDFAGPLYYRLVMYTADGTQYYSDVISVYLSDEQPVSIFPNPAGHTLWITAPTLDIVHVHILSLDGQVLVNQQVGVERGLDITALPQGVYVARIIHDKSKIQHHIFVKE